VYICGIHFISDDDDDSGDDSVVDDGHDDAAADMDVAPIKSQVESIIISSLIVVSLLLIVAVVVAIAAALIIATDGTNGCTYNTPVANRTSANERNTAACAADIHRFLALRLLFSPGIRWPTPHAENLPLPRMVISASHTTL
jgi:hypothetical protein